MQFRFQLPPQLIGLIAGALIFELVFWITIHNLSNGANEDAIQAKLSRTIATKIETVFQEAKDLFSSCADQMQSQEQRFTPFNKSKLDTSFSELKNLVRDNPTKLAVVNAAEANAAKHLDETEALKRSQQSSEEISSQLNPLWVQVQKHEIAVVSEDLKELGAQEKANAEKLTESNVQKLHDINNIKAVCLCFKALVLLLAICFLAKKLTDRLNWIAALLVIQLAAFAALLHSLETESEREVQRNVQALKTLSALREVNSYFADINTLIVQNGLARPRTSHEKDLQGSRYVPLYPDMELDIIACLVDKRHIIAFHYETLHQLLQEAPAQSEIINASKKAADNTFSIMEAMYGRLEKQIKAARVDDIDHSVERRNIWRQIQIDVKRILSAVSSKTISSRSSKRSTS